MSGNVQPYTDLITSEHASAPRFMATVAASCQPFADLLAVLESIPGLYDLDNASGAQLDTVGQWVGISRYLPAPLAGVYFSFDTVGVGFDQGAWFGAFNPTTGLVALPDNGYRTLLGARIAANQWDGTIPTAYQIFGIVFMPQGTSILIQDNGDMTMLLALTGNMPDAVTLAMFAQGLLDIRPAGVQIVQRFAPSVANASYFGFDVEEPSISGFDVGAWGQPASAAVFVGGGGGAPSLDFSQSQNSQYGQIAQGI